MMNTPKSSRGSKGSKGSRRTSGSGTLKASPASKVSGTPKASTTQKTSATPKAPSSPERYHPLLVAIHWIMAILILFNLLYATFVMRRVPNDAEKAPLLMVHMLTGLTILVLVVVRLVVRFATKLPPAVSTGNKLLDLLGVVVHWTLYLAAFGMGVSGLGLALQSGLFASVFAGRGEIPVDFFDYLPRVGHGFLATVLFAVIGLHVAAALFHEIIRKDRMMRRMWFGKAPAAVRRRK